MLYPENPNPRMPEADGTCDASYWNLRRCTADAALQVTSRAASKPRQPPPLILLRSQRGWLTIHRRPLCISDDIHVDPSQPLPSKTVQQILTTEDRNC